jgi:transcriptional regulator with XRE-family HTH domain
VLNTSLWYYLSIETGEDTQMQFGYRIKQLRENNRLTQEEFCKQLPMELTRESLSNIERGKQVPSVVFLKAVVETFHVSPYDLLGITRYEGENEISNYHLLSSKDKDHVVSYIEYLADKSKKGVE